MAFMYRGIEVVRHKSGICENLPILIIFRILNFQLPSNASSVNQMVIILASIFSNLKSWQYPQRFYTIVFHSLLLCVYFVLKLTS